MAKGELMVRIGGTSWIVKAADSAFGGGRERKAKNVLILLKLRSPKRWLECELCESFGTVFCREHPDLCIVAKHLFVHSTVVVPT